jgi:hypothetical protein
MKGPCRQLWYGGAAWNTVKNNLKIQIFLCDCVGHFFSVPFLMASIIFFYGYTVNFFDF